MSGLEIPERARQIACDIYDAALIRDVESEGTQTSGVCAEIQAVEAAAPIIVAAELQRLAAELWDEDHLGPAKKLANRANELDPEGSP